MDIKNYRNDIKKMIGLGATVKGKGNKIGTVTLTVTPYMKNQMNMVIPYVYEYTVKNPWTGKAEKSLIAFLDANPKPHDWPDANMKKQLPGITLLPIAQKGITVEKFVKAMQKQFKINPQVMDIYESDVEGIKKNWGFVPTKLQYKFVRPDKQTIDALTKAGISGLKIVYNPAVYNVVYMTDGDLSLGLH